MDSSSSRNRHKHRLVIQKRFTAFWRLYRVAVVLFYLYRGPLQLYQTQPRWKNNLRSPYFLTVAAMCLSLVWATLVRIVLVVLFTVLTACLPRRFAGKVFVCVHLLSEVLHSYFRWSTTSSSWR